MSGVLHGVFCPWGVRSLSTLDRRRVVAPSMLSDSSQHTKHQKERALYSWWPAPSSVFADGLVVSSRCQTVLSRGVYNVWKHICIWFYIGWNQRSFLGSVEVSVCLCDPIGLHDKSVVFYLISVGFEIVAATVFCSAKAQFWMISEAILIPIIYARLQEIASNFFKIFWGRPPDPLSALAHSALGSGLRPLTGPPFQNTWIRPCWALSWCDSEM